MHHHISYSDTSTQLDKLCFRFEAVEKSIADILRLARVDMDLSDNGLGGQPASSRLPARDRLDE